MAARRTEILQYPRSSACKSRNAFQHIDVADVQIFLILLREAFFGRAVASVQGTAAEFTDKYRFLSIECPVHAVTFLRVAIVPAHILVEADDIQ